MDELYNLVREKFVYNFETGWLIWKDRGTRAGNDYQWNDKRRSKYRRVWLDGHTYLEHRLIWLYVHGSFPKKPFVLDHVNGDGLDNRWGNLRLATRAQNTVNSYKRARRKSVWQDKDGTWNVKLTIGGFETREEAALFAYTTKKQFYGEFVNPEHYGLTSAS